MMFLGSRHLAGNRSIIASAFLGTNFKAKVLPENYHRHKYLPSILIKTSPVILTILNHIWIETVVKLCRAKRDVYVRNAMARSSICSYRRSPPCCLVRAQAQFLGAIPYPHGNGSIDVFPLADDCPATGIPVVAGNFARPDGFPRVSDRRSTLLAELKH